MPQKPNNKPPNIKLPSLGNILLYGAAAFQATQYARAGELLDGGLTTVHLGAIDIPLGLIGGLIAGAVVNFSLAFAATRLPAIEAKAEQYLNKGKAAKSARYARIAFYTLLAMSPLLIAPANFLSMSKDILMGIWWLQVIWALLWSSAMDIAIALVGLIDNNLVSLGTTLSVAKTKTSDASATFSDAGSDVQRQAATLKSRSAKQSATLGATSSDAPAKIYRCECGETFVDRFKYSGHTRTCLVRKEIKSKPIPVDLKAAEKVERK